MSPIDQSVLVPSSPEGVGPHSPVVVLYQSVNNVKEILLLTSVVLGLFPSEGCLFFLGI